MTDLQRHIYDVLHYGQAATLTVTTGTVCPVCTPFGAYTPQGHRDQPAVEDCEGSILITRTLTASNIKGFFFEVLLNSDTSLVNKEMRAVIGELQKDEVATYGLIYTADATEVDLTALDERQDFIIYESQKYAVRHYFTSMGCLKIAVLKRIET